MTSHKGKRKVYSKFIPVSKERPKRKGRPPKYYHPLLEKEQQLESAVRKILPRSIADKICGSGSRLAHLYGLPKTHKENLSMRPILSATGTYNYELAKWLDEKLKPLSINRFTITDTFAFATEIKETKLNEEDILVSFDVSSLFTNVPLDETITILAKKAFTENWFNETYDLNIKESDLVTLLQLATKDQLFQFEGNLYQQIDGVAMGSPLGPLMANAFLCSLEEKLERDNKLPNLYRRYVDDTITAMPDVAGAESFLSTLNECHPSISFTMESASNNKLPFLGMEITKNGCQLSTSVYRKPTNTGLLLHFHSHVDRRYKTSLLRTMVDRAYRLSSTKELFELECKELRSIFSKLKYPNELVDSTILSFIKSKLSNVSSPPPVVPVDQPVRILLPFKDQKSADVLRKQLNNLSNRIGTPLQPIYTSRKLGDALGVKEQKPSLINQHSVVYKFSCPLCDAEYIGLTTRHLFQRIEEHCRSSSSICRHLQQDHDTSPRSLDLAKNFAVLRKCQGKMDCLVYEMLLIKKYRPSLNIQSDSIRAKVFT